MTEAVLDASVVLKWFATEQRGSREALSIRRDYEAGRLTVAVPALLFLEALNIAGRRWGWEEEALLELASAERGQPLVTDDQTIVTIAEAIAQPLMGASAPDS